MTDKIYNISLRKKASKRENGVDIVKSVGIYSTFTDRNLEDINKIKELAGFLNSEKEKGYRENYKAFIMKSDVQKEEDEEDQKMENFYTKDFESFKKYLDSLVNKVRKIDAEEYEGCENNNCDCLNCVEEEHCDCDCHSLESEKDNNIISDLDNSVKQSLDYWLDNWKSEFFYKISSEDIDNWPNLIEEGMKELLQRNFTEEEAENIIMSCLYLDLRESFDYGHRNYSEIKNGDKFRYLGYSKDLANNIGYEKHRYVQARYADNPMNISRTEYEKEDKGIEIFKKYNDFIKGVIIRKNDKKI